MKPLIYLLCLVTSSCLCFSEDLDQPLQTIEKSPNATRDKSSPSETMEVWGGKWDDIWPVFLVLKQGQSTGTYVIAYSWLEHMDDDELSSQVLRGIQKEGFIASKLLVLKTTGDSGMAYGFFKNPRMANLVHIRPPIVPGRSDVEIILSTSGWKQGAIPAKEAFRLITQQ